MVTTLSLVCALGPWAGPAAAQSDAPSSVAALAAPPGAMAEATITADPVRAGHLAAAADPYLDPVRIVVTQSDDGGATWGPPLTILPPGFSKSYDPALGFDDTGELFVVGGASLEGPRHCQPGSAIFAATVGRSGVAYNLIRDTRGDGAYVDRPELVVEGPGTSGAFATWTESTGSGADCRATPARSTIMLARLVDRGSVRDVRPLGSRELEAPFGAVMAVSDGGTLNVAVGDHGSGRTRLVFMRSSDGGATWSSPVVLDSGPDPGLTVPGIGGIVAPVPSLATADGRIAVAWNKGTPAGPEVAVFELTPGGGWAPLGSPAPDGSVRVLPSVTYDRNGHLWLLAGRATTTSLDYGLHRWSGTWDAAVPLGGGPAGGLSELGEALGITHTGSQVIAAFPLDSPSGSSLTVSRLPTPASPVTPPARSGPRPTSTPPGRGPVVSGGRWPFRATAVAMVVLALPAAMACQRRRRHRRARLP